MNSFLDNFFKGIKFDVSSLFVNKEETKEKVSLDIREVTDDVLVEEFIKNLLDKGIKLVCFDFDNTIVDSDYTEEFNHPKRIVNRISPLFFPLATLMLINDIDVAIVTFNLNPLIAEALQKVMKLPIHVYARDDSQKMTGKTFHLNLAMTAYEKKHEQSIKPCDVLLVDDDPTNAAIAHRLGFNCINNQEIICPNDLIEFIES